ncbi:MAG TPA: hypothetical protein VK711_07745 [Puia sp.]|nr:hypothetical protein [Puia sp.]
MRNLIIRLSLPICIIVLVLFSAASRAQELSAASFFKSDTVPALYLGIDFTKAKLINDENSKAGIIQEKQFNGINDLMIKESKKYDFQGAFRRKYWEVDISEVEKRNQQVDPSELLSFNDSDLHWMKKYDVDTLVSGFNFGNHKGYGILLIAEGMNKSKRLMTVWYTLIDMDQKKVLLASLLQGGVIGGFGFRNYWASAINSTIIYIDNKCYRDWKDRFCRNK